MNYPDGQMLVGDCRAMLRTLEAGSVSACITSPPYFGLRSYGGVEPTVWGGDPACVHEWTDQSFQRRSNDNGKTEKQLSNAGANRRDDPVKFAYCAHCPAWRGQLGLEPNLGQFIANLVEVFAEVWRVLRDDGVLFLNLGSSYASGTYESDEMVLRDDLTADEVAYVLREIAAHRQGNKESAPLVTTSVDAAIATFASSEKVDA